MRAPEVLHPAAGAGLRLPVFFGTNPHFLSFHLGVAQN